jgi:hypothetical protein
MQGTYIIPNQGTNTVTVLGAFGSFDPINPNSANYQVSISTSWQTDWQIIQKGATSFTVAFTVASFPDNAPMDWFVEGVLGPGNGSFKSLNDYLEEVRELLRDVLDAGQGQLYSNRLLIQSINRGMQQRDLDLGLNRIRISFPMVTQQFQYPIPTILQQGVVLTSNDTPVASFTQLVPPNSNGVHITGSFQPGYIVLQPGPSWPTTASVQNKTAIGFDVIFTIASPPLPSTSTVDIIIIGVGGVPFPNIIDVLSIVITPLGQPPGGIRYPLGRWPYSRLSYLLSTAYPTYPVKYSMFGVNTIMVAPPPANPYPTEWDFMGYSSALVQGVDTDPMPYPWTDPIPFWACHFAKLSVQRFDEAQAFKSEAQDRTRRVLARGRPLGVADPWSDLPRSAR